MQSFPKRGKRGQKRQCQKCGTQFYDLNRNPAPCPNCRQPLAWTDYAAEEEARRAKAEEQRRVKLLAEENERKRRIQIAGCLKELTQHFESDFRQADYFFQNTFSGLITEYEFKEAKRSFVSDWLTFHKTMGDDLTPDPQQADAVASLSNDTIVSARAGSGKTATLVSRALFLNQHCRVPPERILLLAFNRDAAKEMQKRLKEKSGKHFPHVMTFHALAYAVVKPEEAILYDDPDGAHTKSSTLQELIDSLVRSPQHHSLVKEIMLSHFREDWAKIVLGGYDKSPTAMLQHRRSMPKEGLDGRYYKSEGEKVLANFLLEHGLSYEYEKNHWWNRLNYRPDFTLQTQGSFQIVIEYFGLQGDDEYDALTARKIEYWRSKAGWELLALYPEDFPLNNLEEAYANLASKLGELGIPCERLSENQVWERVKHRAIGRFSTVSANFIQRCRKLTLNSEGLGRLIDQHVPSSEAEAKFLRLMQILFDDYLHRLDQTGQDDFDGLMQTATTIISGGETKFENRSGAGDFGQIEFVLIDEYQDFSELFFNLMSAIREHTPDANFFCVGDDWQAINGFAGSDLKYFDCFEEYFPSSKKLSISTNYRSKSSIVRVGNLLMAESGSAAKCAATEQGEVLVCDLSDFSPSAREADDFLGDDITPALLRIISARLKQGDNVALLTRTNSLPWYVGIEANDLSHYIAHIRSYFPEQDQQRITISTVHKFKGLQCQSVVILDAVARRYPLIHPDLMFTQVFGDSPEKTIQEERRLFYVGLTRAVDRLFVITEKERATSFLGVINAGCKQINWGELRPHTKPVSDDQIYIQVGNAAGHGSTPTMSIKDQLKEAGYRWNPGHWSCWHKSIRAPAEEVVRMINNSKWVQNASGIEVRIINSRDEIISKAIIRSGVANWSTVTL